MGLDEELRRAAEAAVRYAAPGEDVAGIIATEPSPGARAYLCAFRTEDEETAWLVIDAGGRAVESRTAVREVVSIAVLCELAEEFAGGGDLDELRSQLVAVRVTESPTGIEEAEEAALALQTTIGAAPRIASPEHLDAVGSATIRLEQALGGPGQSPFAAAMQNAARTVEELAADVEAHYKGRLR